jgi:hypothetical protein
LIDVVYDEYQSQRPAEPVARPHSEGLFDPISSRALSQRPGAERRLIARQKHLAGQAIAYVLRRCPYHAVIFLS